jgi:predicted nucleic acid-binding protein
MAKRYDVHKIRDLHFDVLIALTARQIGAVLITRNTGDFKTILEFTNFDLVCW